MADVPRDHWDRPLIAIPGEPKLTAYTRSSKLAQTLGDSYALDQWHQQMVAIGIHENPWILKKVEEAKRLDEEKGEITYDWTEMSKVTSLAQEKAGANDKARYGSRLHSLTEDLDRGAEVDWDSLRRTEHDDLMAYMYFTDSLTMHSVEQFGVCDEAKSAGTWDRILEVNGKRRIGDLKTGRLKPLEFAIQMALYSRSQAYTCEHEVKTDDKGKPLKECCEVELAAHNRASLDVELDWGVVLHLPAGEGRLDFYKVDLNKGWEYVELALRVKEARKGHGLLTELDVSTEGIPF